MPIYDFHHGGKTVELMVPAGTQTVEFGGRIYERSKVHRIAVCGVAKEPSASDEVRRGYYKMEQRDGARFRSIFTKNHIRKVWGI